MKMDELKADKFMMNKFLKEIEEMDLATRKERAERMLEMMGSGTLPTSIKNFRLMDYAQHAYENMDDIGCICILRTYAERALKERIRADMVFCLDPLCEQYIEKRMEEIGSRGKETDFMTRIRLMHEYCIKNQDKTTGIKILDHFLKDLERKTFGKLIELAIELKILEKEEINLAKKINKEANLWVHSNFIKELKSNISKGDFAKELRLVFDDISKIDINLNWESVGKDFVIRKEARKYAKELIWDVSYFISRIFSEQGLVKSFTK
jgi:hypothetical protein